MRFLFWHYLVGPDVYSIYGLNKAPVQVQVDADGLPKKKLEWYSDPTNAHKKYADVGIFHRIGIYLSFLCQIISLLFS